MLTLVTFNLDKIFNPKSIAMIGATEKEGSVGAIIMKNLLELGYKGKLFPVNIKKQPVFGRKTYGSVTEIDEPVDLAIIATPAKTVPDILEECGKKNIKGVIIISAGFKEAGEEGKLLYNKIAEIKEKYKLRIIGPNCLGVIRPSIKLNASFATQMPKPGKIAFISQSGALGSAILDWAIHQNVGFSNFVSLGSMIDVDFGDLIDYFGADPLTKSILIYMEGLTNARKFMSAARHFARAKPIIIVKSGKYAESAKAAASHTGSLAGEDMVFEAAFKRAGIVRVNEIEDLFNCAEVLGMQPLPKGPRLAIITNAGGPGVMATDALIAKGGKLAKISDNIMDKLNSILPPYWSRGNPLDILGDATAERYKNTIEACLYDDNIDGILVIYTPQGPAKPEEIANVIVELTKSREIPSKTILTSFIGYETVANANRIFIENNIPAYSTPEQAVATYMYMYQYKRNLELLYETPEELPVETYPPKRPLMVIMRNAAAENREKLNEAESKKFLEYYGLPVAKTITATSEDEAVRVAARLGYPVVMKILSPQIIHKSDAGGVILDIKNEEAVRNAYRQILDNAKRYKPEAEIHGVTISPMIKFKGTEVILGAKKDPLFGPIVLFGMGGIGVELFKDVSVGLPPLNETLAKRIMEETKVYKLLKGFRNIPPADIKLLEGAMVRFSNMLVDFPQ
ncbi:MAG: acetate--CoA ligase family protein, partial [Candidatus Odinarchaeota archaeon]